jgi:beta-galactosidase/beta-glucuronidase
MPAQLKKTILATALACVALAGTAAAALAPPSQLLIFEGPSGRVPLTEWVLRKDPADSGTRLGWAGGGFAGAQVRVPNVVSPSPYSGRAGGLNYQGSVAWYRTTIQAASAGTYALSFQSANFRASIYLDGHLLGSHQGSFLPFEVRSAMAAGSHTVVVRVDWRNPGRQSREGFHRTWFNWGGLDGEVTLRPIGPSELEQPSIQTTLLPGAGGTPQASVKVSVLLRNNGSRRTLQPTGSLTRPGQTVALAFGALTLSHGQAVTATTTVTLAEPALWSPSSPSLYQLELAVPEESGYSARVGLRQITWHGGVLALNGHRLRLHGASIQEDVPGHGDALTPGDQDGIVDELRAIGANALRSQHPLDPALLERLDAAGMFVWQGLGPVEGAGNWYSSTPTLLAGAEQQAREAATAAMTHPSIFAWNLVNEVAGNGRNAAEVSYVRGLAGWLHRIDPGRMVAVDVWGRHPPSQAGPLYANVDAVAETDYSGWYESPGEGTAQMVAQMRTRLSAMERTFRGKVLVISEFGAESNTLNPPGSPGSYAFQSRLLKAHITTYAADPHLTAMLVWVLRDYPLTPTFQGGSIRRVLHHLRLIEGINQKGLFTYAGRPKPAAAVVGGLFRALPEG